MQNLFTGWRSKSSFAILGLACVLGFAWSLRVTGATNAGRVYVIASDSHRGLVTQSLPATDYTRFLATTMGSVSDAVKPVLAKRSTPQAQPRWELRTIGVGLGISGQIGLGPIWNITVTPGLRLVFSNSKNPVYPD